MVMSSNLGRKVKWQDNKGGWHTGREVTTPLGVGVTYLELRLVKRYIMPPYDDSSIPHGLTLIKEDHCGTLTWVESNKLQSWPDVKYCSVCCKEQDKCECGKAVTISKPSNQLPTPQSKVTREEVLQAASEESMLSQRSLLQQALEQIKEEEEGLLRANKELSMEANQLQEEYAEQLIQNQIERNYS